eukprot:Opistho-2@6120
MATQDGKKVAIVGSGLIGRCWAMLFARANFYPVLFDIEPKQLEAASESVLAQLKGLESGGLLRGQRAEDVFARVSTTSNLRDALTGAIYLQECVPELVDLKKKIFGQLDELATELGNSEIVLKLHVVHHGVVVHGASEAPRSVPCGASHQPAPLHSAGGASPRAMDSPEHCGACA